MSITVARRLYWCMTKLKTKTDMQETKKKVLEGNTSGNLLNYLVFREQSVPKQKQPNDSPMLQLWSNMWSKKFRNSGWCESGGKTRDFAPEMQKIKPKTVRFRLYLVCSTTPTDVGSSSRALCVLSYRFRPKTPAPRAFFVHCFRIFRVCLW